MRTSSECTVEIQRSAHGKSEHMHMHMPRHIAIACSLIVIAPTSHLLSVFSLIDAMIHQTSTLCQ